MSITLISERTNVREGSIIFLEVHNDFRNLHIYSLFLSLSLILCSSSAPRAFLSLSLLSTYTNRYSQQPFQLYTMSNNNKNNSSSNNNLMPCQDCKEHFPLYALEGPLSVHFRDASGIHGALLCLKCTRKALKFVKEPYSHQVTAYSDPTFGATIIPRISGSEAKLQYGLDDSILELLPHITARFVPSAGVVYKVKIYEEREILDRARWMFGGDVGVLHARRVLA